MRILVTGASGQLARAVQTCWHGHELLLPPRSELDLADFGSVVRSVRTAAPDVVLNAAAFTQVDRCEAEPETAMRVNGEAVGFLARACAERGALLVQISTDYVFAGQGLRPYGEDDPVGPVSAYGRSKLRGEEEAARAPHHLIVRTAWLYDAWGRNFFNAMRGAAAQGRALKVVVDQTGSPTSCRALARQIQTAVEEGWRGLVHATCRGETSWHGFAAEIFRQCRIEADLSPCATAGYPLPAARPAYSVLSGEKRARLGTDRMPGWRDALAEVVADTMITSKGTP